MAKKDLTCRRPPRTVQAAARADLVRQAFRLEYLTLAWMTVEAAVGIGAGIAAGSLALIAFGADSLIELASAGVLVWRLNVELRHGAGIRRERRAPGGADRRRAACSRSRLMW